MAAPISTLEIVLAFVGAGATKTLIVGFVIFITATFFVEVDVKYPLLMIFLLVLVAFTFALFGFLIGIFWTPFFSQNGSMSIIDTLSAFFGPIFGVMIFDYYVVKNKVVINKDLFSARDDSVYLYSGGWHLKAYYSFVIGFIFSSATIWNSKFMFLDTFSFIIGFIIAGITYYLLASD